MALSAAALVAVVGGGAALALHSGSRPKAPVPIVVQSEQPATGGAISSTTAASASRLAGPDANFTFVLSGALPALDGDRPAWHLPASPTADLGAIAALAKTLGLEGDVSVVDGGWNVGDQNGGQSLYVGKAPGLPWYYADISTKEAYACPAVTTVPSTGDVVTTILSPECVAPPPPVGVPTKDDALAKAGDLFKALGVDTSSYTVAFAGSEWSAEVQAIPMFDGIGAPTLMSSISFGGEGKLQYANGYLLAPEKADSYPRIGTLKAFDSLKSGSGAKGIVVGTNCNGYDPAGVTTTIPVDQPMSPSAITCGSIVCGFAPVTTIPGTAPIDATTAPPPPCVEPSAPQPVTITITGAHETLLPLMGADGSTWLVPGYEFSAADGGTWPVLAIDQSFVDQVAPPQPVPETKVAMGNSSAPPPSTAGG
ncbi:MAG: hypothetical protein ABJD24_04070 [Acidimicrobiales bacterium]